MVKTFRNLNPFKTIYFNLKMFPLRQALKLPVFIGYHTKFVSLKGNLQIEGPLKMGMIRFGFGDVGVVDKKYCRTLIELNGTILFKNRASLGYGSKISVGNAAILKIGDRFNISANSTVICFESVTFDDNVLLSWDVQVMDTDFHATINTLTGKINEKVSKPIYLGANTWIGTRSILLKGTRIPANTIIGAGSLLNKEYTIEENCLLAGNPAKVLKTNIRRI